MTVRNESDGTVSFLMQLKCILDRRHIVHRLKFTFDSLFRCLFFPVVCSVKLFLQKFFLLNYYFFFPDLSSCTATHNRVIMAVLSIGSISVCAVRLR